MPPKIIIKESDIARMTAQQPENTSLARRYFSKVSMHPSTLVANSRIKKETGNIPVVGRGGPGVRPKHGLESQYTSPMPVEIDDTLSAVEMDEYERLDNRGKQQVLDEYTAEHFAQVRETVNALCCQALRGKIDYMMKSSGAPTRYVVDYGTMRTISFPKMLDKIKYVDAVKDLSDMAKAVRRNGVGGNVEFVAAGDVYGRFVEILAANNTTSDQNKGDHLLIGPHKVYQDNDIYFDTDENGNKVEKSLCKPGEICCRALNAGQSLLYCKLDNTVQRSAVAFYSFAKERDDQRGTDLYSKSKPFPLVNVKGVVWGKYSTTQYTVTFSAGSNGTIAASVNGEAVTSGAKVKDGETVIFTLSPADGYELDAWGGTDGAEIISNDDETFGLVVDKNKTVSVSFKEAS